MEGILFAALFQNVTPEGLYIILYLSLYQIVMKALFINSAYFTLVLVLHFASDFFIIKI